MKTSLSIIVRTAAVFGLAVGCAATAAGQAAREAGVPTSRAQLLRADLKPGEVLRYELEANASFLPQAEVAGAAVTPASGPCDYSLAAIVTLRPQPPDKNGNTPVEATYSDARVNSVKCAPLTAIEFQKQLSALQQSPVTFRIGPHGETGVVRSSEKYFNYWNGADLLHKVTQDLLQTQFSSKPVAPGDSWKPRGQFAYAKDNGLHQLELSAANLRFKDIVAVDGKSCVWVTSKYVFSPLDVPASATTPEGRVVQGAGNNAVAAVLEISLLLDPAAHHVAWLQRSQTIDNRLTLAAAYNSDDPSNYDAPDNGSPSDDPDTDQRDMEQPDSDNPMPDMPGTHGGRSQRHPFMSFHFQEEAKARLLPQEHAMEWLAALHRFEQSPEPENDRGPLVAPKGSVAQAAKSATLKKTKRVVIDADTMASTPAGFTRYEKGLCRDAWFCAAVSVALPGRVEISEDTPVRSVYLAKKDDVALSIAIGPALDRRALGLTEEEELAKQAKYYLSNYVWLAVKPGASLNSSSATIDGYPALITEFSATQRDAAGIHGWLGVVLTPWGKVVPVSCGSDHASSAELQSICGQVIASITVRR